MKTNKMLPDSSISKVWENFRKMNGIVIEFLANNWVSQSNGTFTNTVSYEGFTSDEILEVDLYDDGTLTETQITEYDGYITEFNVENGKIVAVATTLPTQSIKILARGEIVGKKVVVNGGGSSDISASDVSCLDKDGQTSNVQKELDEQNKKLVNTEWITLNATHALKYKVTNNIVCVSISTNKAISENTVVGTIPEEHRPTAKSDLTTSFGARNIYADNTGNFMILTNDGQLLVRYAHGAGGWFITTFSYPLG